MGKDKDDHIKNPVNAYKKKVKRFVCCGCSWFWIGLAVFVIGIVLLVFYAKYWGTENWRRGIAYTGTAFLIAGFIVVTVGIAIFVTLCILARRLDKSGRPLPPLGADTYHKTNYTYGEAPYPQQPPPSQPMMNPEHPLAPTGPPADEKDVKIDVTPHDKY